MAEQETAKRQVAYKVKIADIINNRYVKEEGWLPNYIAVGNIKVSRVNILGVIVSKDSQDSDKPSQNFILDDGSGRIALRFFDGLTTFDVGSIVTVVGRPREFGADRYIVPEIIKKIKDSKWVNVRKIELAAETPTTNHVDPPVENSSVDSEEISVETENFVDVSDESVDITNIIKELDSGSGVGFDEISVKSKDVDVEKVIKRLLEQGDIFEVKPGRYKVLE